MASFYKPLVIRCDINFLYVKKFSRTLQGNNKNCVELHNCTFIKQTLKISQHLYRFISKFPEISFHCTLFKHSPLLSLSSGRSYQSFLVYFHRMLAVVLILQNSFPRLGLFAKQKEMKRKLTELLQDFQYTAAHYFQLDLNNQCAYQRLRNASFSENFAYVLGK